MSTQATQIMGPSVWAAMNYTPPRGKCNFKNGLMSGTCSCLRFMLHPVKVSYPRRREYLQMDN